MDSKENKRVGSLQSWSKQGTVRHRPSKEGSIYRHTMRKQVSCLEKDNARNNARCTQARKTTHGLNGQQQDVTASRILLSAFRVSAFYQQPQAALLRDQNGPEFTEQKLTFKHALSLQQ